MIGEAANHKTEMLEQMTSSVEVVVLPSRAAYETEFDSFISKDDVVVSLHYKRTEKGPEFRLLHVPGAGLDGIDLVSLPRGCLLCNVYEHQIPIAEYVMLAMLEWEIRFAQMRERFVSESWAVNYHSRIPHGELFSKTLGLIGFGRIGFNIALRARAFGMRILAVDKFASDDEKVTDLLVSNDQIEEVLEQSDFVVISCPLNSETQNWIDATKIEKMKKNAVLINVSRGPVVNQKDIYEALIAHKIGGAVFDVWWNYPKSENNVYPAEYPFHLLDNVFCTPHSCAWTKELTRRRYGVIARNIENLRDGRPLLHLIGDYQ